MRLLFATDGSRGADIALDFLGSLPLSNADHLVVLTVPTYTFVGSNGVGTRSTDVRIEHGESAARAIAEDARTRLSHRGCSVAVDIAEGSVASAIEAAALRHATELVVIGSRGLGAFAGTIRGSIARRLARLASVPILVVRERREAPRRIVLAVDGSEESSAALGLLARLPLPAATRVTLLRIIGSPSDAAAVARVMARAPRVLDSLAMDRELAARTHAPEEILAGANATGADLIVLGSGGQATGGVLQPSLADQVLSHAHCAVLVARAPTRPRLAAEHYAEVPQLALAL